MRVGRRGRKRQLDLESEYWKLLQSGVGTVAACKLLGIGRKTGYRWRTENGGLPPAWLAESSRWSRFLSPLERQRIATLQGRGLGVRETARRLGRSPSTVSRELRRNLRPHDRGLYDGDLAHARARNRARNRARRPRRPLLAREPELRRIVQQKAEGEWSRRRSLRTRTRPFRTGPRGTCARRRSTRASTTAEGRVEQDLDQEAADRSAAAQAPVQPGRPDAAIPRPGPADRPAPGRGRTPHPDGRATSSSAG